MDVEDNGGEGDREVGGSEGAADGGSDCTVELGVDVGGVADT